MRTDANEVGTGTLAQLYHKKPFWLFMCVSNQDHFHQEKLQCILKSALKPVSAPSSPHLAAAILRELPLNSVPPTQELILRRHAYDRSGR